MTFESLLITNRGKWGKMCHGVSLATPFSQLLLFQISPIFLLKDGGNTMFRLVLST